ncbi:MAG: 16S rRNA (adenine(1518)-N(6)/adenine(1519)-N(6))-dimethyltransferase RsmA [Chitinophagales bacterium]|nr:16S rRNA (adenine(1518)-N(6)/adenine(1519)-N(6))-dimethyltransferase RsmA [Chitinophagales bacterium]
MQRVQPNKNYGQHFLKDKTVVERTVDIIKSLHTANKLIEIGPGTGALTSALIPEFIDILNCIEVDERCVEYLHTHFQELQGKIIHKDFLKVPLGDILLPSSTIVGNFPYNISSQIVFKIIEYRDFIPNMVGMFQKEVADRIAAPHGNKQYGIISVMTQLYYEAEIAFDIPPEAFNPPPKVMSSVLVLKRRESPLKVNHSLLVKVVKAGFNQRRKTLRNALSQVAPSSILSEEIFNKRAEQLSVQDFVALTNKIESLL